jgi:hypothetical protein
MMDSTGPVLYLDIELSSSRKRLVLSLFPVAAKEYISQFLVSVEHAFSASVTHVQPDLPLRLLVWKPAVLPGIQSHGIANLIVRAGFCSFLFHISERPECARETKP